MQKIISVYDGLEFSNATLEYSTQIAKAENAHLTGVFLDDVTYTSYKIYELVLERGVSEQKLKKFKDDDKLLRSESAQKFENICKQTSLNYNVHHDKNVALQELVHESIFADLMIIDNKESFTHHEEKYPSRFMKDVLSNTQCPILLISGKYKPFEKIIFLYDGKQGSVYALKMFNYLFSKINKLPLEIITIKTMEENLHLPDNSLMKEYVKRHYEKVDFTVLKGLAEVEVVNHLKFEKLNCLVVLGAYRKTMLTRWFKSSMADALIKELDIPLFIAHNK